MGTDMAARFARDTAGHQTAAAEARAEGYHEGMRDAQEAYRAREQEMLDGIAAHNAAGGEGGDE